MITRARERYYPLKQVTDFLPIDDEPPCYETVRQWTELGVRGVKLEFVWIGRRKHVSKEAIDRFLDALNSPQQPAAPPRAPGRATIAERKRLAAEARERMRARAGK